ncbi:PKD domain-containing protein [Zobellia laminariae]|uniref:PKD domain-containing protein n=1 Tax=Zobellia laminariae TaxID=248906 RepID=UPI0034CEB21D
MKGNLLAGSSRGILRRVELKADGTLKNFTPEFLGGIGGNALGVTCNGDSEIFTGTIWAGTLNGKIVVFEPMEGEALTFPFRINSGGPEVSHEGNLFHADDYFFNGQSYTNSSVKIPELYQTERFDSKNNLDYKIPVPNGNYEVVLHFAEIYWGATGGVAGGIGNRVFDVNIEDVLVLDDYDIVADVGSETPVAKSFLVTVSDGELNLNFSALASTGGVNSPKVSAIEILTDSNESPVAIASASPMNGIGPLNVDFTGANSTDDIEVISYIWDFKDGSTSSLANPKHTFTTSGIYEVELTVQDSEKLTNSTTLTITVVDNQNQDTVRGIYASPDNGTAPLEVSFTVLNEVDDVAATSYLWDFGDGSKSSSIMEPSHVFSEKGIYEVSLTIIDAQGLSHSQTTTVTVIDEKTEEESIVGILMKNPVKEMAQVRIVANGTDIVKVIKIYLHDSSGRIVGIYNAKDIVSNGLYQIPIASLSTGQIYYLSFEIDKGKRLVFSMLVDN